MYGSRFTTTSTSNIGQYISRTLSGFSTNMCLTECFFTSANDCHFIVSIGTTCYIGTFKLWPLDNPPAYPTSTVYIFNGQYFVCLIAEESYLIFNVMLMAFTVI